MDDEGTNRENADEGAEICAGGEATAGRINFGVERGDDHDADEDGDHAVGHDFHHGVLGAVDVGILLELALHAGQGGEQGEAEHEVGDGGAERGESEVGVVHGYSFCRGTGFAEDSTWEGNFRWGDLSGPGSAAAKLLLSSSSTNGLHLPSAGTQSPVANLSVELFLLRLISYARELAEESAGDSPALHLLQGPSADAAQSRGRSRPPGLATRQRPPGRLPAH